MNFINSLKNNISDFFRPVLSDRTILKYNKKGLLIEGNIDPIQLQPNSVDLTLSNSWKVLQFNSCVVELGIESECNKLIIDPQQKIEYSSGLFTQGENNKNYYLIPPKSFVLMASNEVLNIPNGIIGFVQGRSSIARLAIQTEQAGLIDSGFRGTITFEVFNQSDYPIILYAGMRIAQVYFFKAQHALTLYGIDKGSKYNGQIEATGSMIHLDKK